jgi:hypothetical protein
MLSDFNPPDFVVPHPGYRRWSRDIVVSGVIDFALNSGTLLWLRQRVVGVVLATIGTVGLGLVGRGLRHDECSSVIPGL